LEKIAGVEVIRPDIAGIMGAFGAALIARERYYAADKPETTMLSFEKIENLSFETSMTKCRGCLNECRLTVNRFTGGRHFISGNRCERGLGKPKNANGIPNLFEYKLERTFAYTPLPLEKIRRGKVGIPRVLNLYENFPFWQVFFAKLGYAVILSPSSTRAIYELGIESIPSESECYPAKLAHGHIEWLLHQDIDFIFYPAVYYERTEIEGVGNHYNCPIVTSYSENIKNNVDNLNKSPIGFLNPFISFSSEETLYVGLKDAFTDIPEKELKEAIHAGWEEMANVRRDIQKKGEETLAYLKETGRHGIVLAGRPYHIDPEINHGIPELITSFGMAVLTEDSVSHLGKPERPLIVSDQWTYHSRLYAAASFVRTREDLDLVQLNSFGCGLDAVTTDQVNDILSGSGKIYTCLKIDEVNNLGAARIRIRSLLAAIRVRKQQKKEREIRSTAITRISFTKKMRDTYTILCPQFSPIHFEIMRPGFESLGYRIVVLSNANRHAVDTGLQFVNNDACYPSMLVVGQIMDALQSGEYDPDKCAVIMSQTGGGCRATNYVGFLRRALEKGGFGQVPVISLNLVGLEQNPGFKITLPLLIKAGYGAIFGDILMKCLLRMRPYEMEKGSADALYRKWATVCQQYLIKRHQSYHRFTSICREIVADFDRLPINEGLRKPRVGIVGEILVKYSPAGNNHLVKLLEEEGAEAVVPDLMGFLLYCFYNQDFKARHLGTPQKSAWIAKMGIRFIEFLQKSANEAYGKSQHFSQSAKIDRLADFAAPIVSIGNQTGEGWFLTGEMLELIHEGADNIICCQPFGCLPNHVVGKGVIKEIRKRYPMANIVAIDYDPGASEVNQLNRIKLMLGSAMKKLERENYSENSSCYAAS
ncbi:MAG: 2-hydroxyacyl-CoA dehydratase, partial [Lachnospiraceae bacterium]|nr:2-hydroxyacyl-CoA dehydratase [Lachnospiraceae bacterium]